MPGLEAFIAIGMAVISMLIFSWKHAASRSDSLGISQQDLSLGLIGGLGAHFVYSLTDAIALGARPGFLLWMAFGLSTALYLKGVRLGSSKAPSVRKKHGVLIPGMNPAGPSKEGR